MRDSAALRVAVWGRGAREVAVAEAIARSPRVAQLWVTGDNPGWPSVAKVVPESPVGAFAAWAIDHHIDLVVVGPEAPLVAGVADALRAGNIACFGPTQAAARIEGSKSFAKDLVRELGVPTAPAITVQPDDPTSVVRGRSRCASGSVALKRDGLAGGKGVVVCVSPADAVAAFDAYSVRGELFLVEDRVSGVEVSVFALSDGERVVALPAVRDHKRLGDGDTGPNTGGMGAVAPVLSAAETADLVRRIHAPVVAELARRGTPFRGVLYAGLMLTDSGPVVLEFNARFGDPEAQVLFALWDDDPVPWLFGAAIGSLPSGEPRFRSGAACCVVVAAPGYPDAPRLGTPIAKWSSRDVAVHPAGVTVTNGVATTSGGRVFSVTAVGADVETARAKVYARVPALRFPGAQWRTDIGVSP